MAMISRLDPGSAEAQEALASYVAEMFERGVWKGEPDPTEGIGRFRPPEGVFVVATSEGASIACGGLKTFSPEIGEIGRMWVAPSFRRRGVGSSILSELEGAAREMCFRLVRLDTNQVLVEAVELYSRRGYSPIPRYNESYDATHFFEKEL